MVVVIMEDHIVVVVILLLMEIPNLLIGGLNHNYVVNKSINHKLITKKKYIL